MTAALIVFSVFAGIAVVIATTAATILYAHGKLTLPGSQARRLQQAKVDLEVARFRLEADRVRAEHDRLIETRMRLALTKGDEE